MQTLEPMDVTGRSYGPAADDGRKAVTAAAQDAVNKQGQIAQARHSHLDAPTVDDGPQIGVR